MMQQPYLFIPLNEYQNLLANRNEEKQYTKELKSENIKSPEEAINEDNETEAGNVTEEPKEKDEKELKKSDLHEIIHSVSHYKRKKLKSIIKAIEQHDEFNQFQNLDELIKQAISTKKKKIPNEEEFYKLLFKCNLGSYVTNSYKIKEYFSTDTTKGSEWWHV